MVADGIAIFAMAILCFVAPLYLSQTDGIKILQQAGEISGGKMVIH